MLSSGNVGDPSDFLDGLTIERCLEISGECLAQANRYARADDIRDLTNRYMALARLYHEQAELLMRADRHKELMIATVTAGGDTAVAEK